MDKTKAIYFNPAQLKVMQRQCNTVVVVGGRRLGKSHGIVAPFALRNVQYMPGSSGGYVASTFQQALTRTLPGTMKALDDFKYKRNVHYYVGRKPPKTARFKSPIIEPESYDHVISWYNGSIQYIISQDGVGTSNSLTLDYGIFDEAKYLDHAKLREETFPAIGGNQSYFMKSQFYRSKLIVSDMPMTKKGSWFLDYAKESDPELIATIDGIIYKLWEIRERINREKDKAPGYLLNEYKTLSKKLAQLRRIAVDYNEFSSLENLEVLGESYIKQMKRDLPPLVFMTSILCLKIRNSQDGFYNNLKESVHYYSKYNNDYLQGLDYDFDKASEVSCLQDGDLNLYAPIQIAFDYNANINWLVAGQVNGQRLYVIKSFYVKYERKLVELVNDFCDYYRFHKRKEVVYYVDSTALASNYAVNEEDFASVVEMTFRKHGWYVTRVFIGNPMKHHEKHRIINMGLKGDSGLFPMFNKDNNEELLLSMEQAGVHISANGFRKDKRGEKLVETEEDKLETRTDGSDAFDTLFIGCNNFPAGTSGYTGLASSFA
jgi:hypothetical protein